MFINTRQSAQFCAIYQTRDTKEHFPPQSDRYHSITRHGHQFPVVLKLITHSFTSPLYYFLCAANGVLLYGRRSRQCRCRLDNAKARTRIIVVIGIFTVCGIGIRVLGREYGGGLIFIPGDTLLGRRWWPSGGYDPNKTSF